MPKKSISNLDYDDPLDMAQTITVATCGSCEVIGHVAPEAYVGGAIALVKDGDEITIDIPGTKVELHVSDSDFDPDFDSNAKN